MRLDKYLCDCNIGSRSEVKKIIGAGRIRVDGRVAKSPSEKVNEDTPVELDGERVSYEKYRYFLLNKPAGCVSAVKDNIHKTVMEYLAGENLKDCAPVGRLDLDTEGIILITNDGELAHRLLSPAKHVWKTYFAVLDKPCPGEAISLFNEGVDIGDEKPTLPAKLEILEGMGARLSIREGRFHQVKRMFESVGCQVTYLKRETFGSLELGDLEPGEYRKLTAETVVLLSKGKISSQNVRVEFSLEDMDITSVRGKATYEQIKN